MRPEILILGIEFLIHSMILLALLWIMIKLQNLIIIFWDCLARLPLLVPWT